MGWGETHSWWARWPCFYPRVPEEPAELPRGVLLCEGQAWPGVEGCPVCNVSALSSSWVSSMGINQQSLQPRCEITHIFQLGMLSLTGDGGQGSTQCRPQAHVPVSQPLL